MFDWLRTSSITRQALALEAKARLERARARYLRAKYDAAQTTNENTRHWANADALSADVAMSASVRGILRKRARYEVANNTYAKGIVLTRANHTVSIGPKLQMLTADADLNAEVEAAWLAWSNEIGLAAKLRTMCHAKIVDGEAFALVVDNRALRNGVPLDLRLLEAEQVATPATESLGDDIDGILLDQYGNPRQYYILREHPGGSSTAMTTEYDLVDAPQVFHWFRADRPGQHRGVSELTPALPLFAQLRRYTLAVLTAAETAADFTLLLKSTSSPETADQAVDTLDVLEIERNLMTVLPEGWDPFQIQPQQPCSTYAEFKRQILNEIARCLNIPYNIAACDSSTYNYASGRLDHQTYFVDIAVEQHHLELTVLDRLLSVWYGEARAARGWGDAAGLPHEWFWRGLEHVDPSKEANAQETRLKNHTTTFAHEYAREGLDWEAQLRQRGKEMALLRELGLPVVSSGKPAADVDDQIEEALDERT